MNRKPAAALVALLIAAAPLPSLSQDGMWLPHQLPLLDLPKQGLTMDPAALYREDGTGLMNAVVTFEDGGTAEFVSADGLLLTNHHIASPALQRSSTPGADLLASGFVAGSRAAEMSGPGLTVDVPIGYREVTREVVAAIPTAAPVAERHKAIERAKRQLVATAEREAPDVVAKVASLYGGNQYFLYRYKRLRDVRIAYAPPLALGRYGGDIDNWMWPRHATDFAFLRAYVSPDGIGVPYAPGNVPYRPKSFLRISREDIDPGQFAFVVGYPHVTSRTRSAAELRYELGRITRRGEAYGDVGRYLAAAGETREGVRIRYATTVRQMGNVSKNVQAKLAGTALHDVLERKARDEQAFAAWVAADAARAGEYGRVLADLDALMARYEQHSFRAYALQDVVNPLATTTLLAQAHKLWRAAVERQRPDAERDPEFSDRNLGAVRERVESAELEYELTTDRAFLKHRLGRLARQPAEYVPAALQPLMARGSAAEIGAFVDDLYARTRMADPKRRLEYLAMDPATLLAQGDPLVRLAADLDVDVQAAYDRGDALDLERAELNARYLKGVLLQRDGRLAADANETLRLAYGTVAGYSPADAVQYAPQTTLAGLVRKGRGEAPFEVPARVAELHARRDFGRWVDPDLGEVPVCLLTSAVITGGNSGSPTLNAKGELIGVVFDMTYESVVSDYYLIPEVTRTVSVDIRNVLFLTEKMAGATYILKELGF
jgi:Peptidase S46